jgi:hypothetical protein
LTTTGGLKFVEHLHPSSLKTLKNLELLFDISLLDPYSGACDDLALLAAAKCPLKSIKLQLCSVDDIEFTTETEVWSRLADVLNLSTFPTLRDVTIYVSVSFCKLRGMREQLEQMAQVAFKPLAHEPSINFCFSVNQETDT